MIMNPSKNRNEHLIYQRRAQQEKLDTLNGKLKQEFYHKEFARWQNKGANVQKAGQIKRRLQEMRDDAKKDLNYRKQRLCALLQSEHQKFQKEILDRQETPEQVRARMAERVKQLKQERQNERKLYVEEQLDRRFELNADQLRKVDAELKELRTDLDRNVQLMEKQNVMTNQFEEQMLFAELNKREIKKREEVEKQKAKEARDKIQERNAILSMQREMKQQRSKKEKDMSEMEKGMLKEEWERDRESQKYREQEAALRSKEIAKQLIQSNENQRRIKQMLAQREKQTDKDLLDQVLARERQQAEAQKEQKAREREQVKKTLAGFKVKSGQAQAQEKELERLIEHQRLKKEEKQYQQWMKAEDARVKLLHDVYNDREKKVKDNIYQREQQKRQKEVQKQKVVSSVQQHSQQQQQRRNRDLIRNKQDQQRLLEEIRLKEEKRRKLLLELQKEESQMSKARRQYDQKILQRKQKGKQQLDQFKKTNSIF